MGKKILKGTPASLGQVRGLVKIYQDFSTKKQFNKGDILVVEMTDPRYMEIIMKAGGIVTDIGGILSHAAIVARELEIPCVVNTKEATKILKNDQVIFINADKGEIEYE